MRVAVLGLGRMGRPIARHVVQGGHDVAVWNRTPGRAGDLIEAGARECTSAAEAARDADVVVLVLFGPESVREVLTGHGGVADAAPRGAVIIDATTVGPSDARGVADSLQGFGLGYVDAPLFGSVEPAENGTLGTYLGGRADDIAVARPVVECWCDPALVVHAGPVGAGAAVKIVRNMGHGIATAAIGECLRLAADLGVPRDVALTAVANGPFGWTYGWREREIAERDATSVVFSLDLMTKDLALAVDEATRPLPVSRTALAQCHAAQADGRGAEDYVALADWVEGPPAT